MPLPSVRPSGFPGEHAWINRARRPTFVLSVDPFAQIVRPFWSCCIPHRQQTRSTVSVPALQDQFDLEMRSNGLHQKAVTGQNPPRV
jgi:hypothetical protein